jgi:hypothetical protein
MVDHRLNSPALLVTLNSQFKFIVGSSFAKTPTVTKSSQHVYSYCHPLLHTIASGGVCAFRANVTARGGIVFVSEEICPASVVSWQSF